MAAGDVTVLGSDSFINATSGAIAITNPTEGQILCVAFGINSYGTAPSIDTSSGWTSVSVNRAASSQAVLWYKIASAADAALTQIDLTFNDTGTGGAVVFTVEGVTSATLLDSDSEHNNASATGTLALTHTSADAVYIDIATSQGSTSHAFTGTTELYVSPISGSNGPLGVGTSYATGSTGNSSSQTFGGSFNYSHLAVAFEVSASSTPANIATSTINVVSALLSPTLVAQASSDVVVSSINILASLGPYQAAIQSIVDPSTVASTLNVGLPAIGQTSEGTVQADTINASASLLSPDISIGIEVSPISVSIIIDHPITVGTGVSPAPESISIATSISEPALGFLTTTEITVQSSISTPTISITKDADAIPSTISANASLTTPGIFDYDPSIPVPLVIDTLVRVNDVDIYYELSKTVPVSTIGATATMEKTLISGPPDIDWLFGGIELAWKFDTLSLQALIIDPEEFTSG